MVKHWDHDGKNHPLQLPFDGFADKAVAVVVFLLILHLNYHMATKKEKILRICEKPFLFSTYPKTYITIIWIVS